MYRNPKYISWIKEATWVAKLGKHQQIKGEFSATIILNPPNKRLFDIDNRIKVVLDLAQSTALIENDHLCRLLIVSYGVDEQPGATLILAAMDSVFVVIDGTAGSGVAKASNL